MTYANPDGTFTSELSAGPVRIPDAEAEGGWRPIDTTLEDGRDGVRPVAAAAEVRFSAGGAEPLAQFTSGKRSIEVSWPGRLPKPALSEDTATYADVMPGVDLVVRALPAGFSQSLVVNEPSKEPLTIRYPLRVEGLVPSINEFGALTFSRPDGTVVASSDQALMWDSAIGDRSTEPEKQAFVQTQLVETPDGLTLEVTPDAAFLAREDLEYPLVIDPTVTLEVSKDTYVHSQYPNQTYTNENELKVGKVPVAGSEKARSLIKFTTGSIDGKHVLEAKLRLYETWSYSCTNTNTRVYRVNSSWTGPTWNNQPTYGAIYAEKSFAKGYSGSCPDGWVVFDDGDPYSGNTVTDLVQGWAEGSIENNGLAVRAADESATNSWKIFRSSDASSNHPELVVTYNSIPNTPKTLSPAEDVYSTTTRPTLHGKSCDPDGGKLRVNFQVYNSAGSSLMTSSDTSRAKVSSCTDHPWTVPLNELTDGSSYRWRARGDDGTDVSAWTSTAANGRLITIDATTPTAPVISSSSHGSQSTWYPSHQQSFIASWTASTDATSGVAGYAVQLDQSPDFNPLGVTQTGTTFSETLQADGVWYLHVAARDGAGNWGEVSHYAVHLGTSAVTRPASFERTHRFLTLQGQAPSPETSARFQYRLSDVDAEWVERHPCRRRYRARDR